MKLQHVHMPVDRVGQASSQNDAMRQSYSAGAYRPSTLSYLNLHPLLRERRLASVHSSLCTRQPSMDIPLPFLDHSSYFRLHLKTHVGICLVVVNLRIPGFSGLRTPRWRYFALVQGLAYLAPLLRISTHTLLRAGQSPLDVALPFLDCSSRFRLHLKCL
jgi:hypothetical protein